MRKLKITSLILVVVMLVGMLPMGIFSASAAPAAPATVPSGTDGVNWSYTAKDAPGSGVKAISAAAAANSVTGNLAYRWRGLEGFLLQIDTTAASKLFLQVPMSYGSFGVASYMRITMAQYNQGMAKDKVGSAESDAYIYDGTSWTKQTTNNWDDCYVDLPANFSGYLYVPFDQFYWQGNGNNGNVNNGSTALKGVTAEYFLSHFDTPNLSQLNVWTDKANTMTVNSTKLVYADKNLAPTANDVAESYAWTSISDSAEGAVRKAQTVGNSATYELSKVNAKPGTGVFASSANAYEDLTDVKGVSVHVDTTGLTDGRQLQVRPYLQWIGGFSDTPYRDNMIVNTTGNVSNGSVTFYDSFYSDESYCQFVTRTPNAVAYLREDGSSTWTAIYNTCDGSGIATDGSFVLPANFKGDVYVPMDSYWFCHFNNSGNIIIPFKYSLVKDFKSFGLFNSVSGAALGEGEANTVVYSGFSLWRDASYNVVEIGTEEELLNFFNNLNNYDGKKVVLTNDIILNAGWDAASGTAPATKLANRTAANTYFAGTFDGQNHVISGLYLESDLNALGLFGNVKHHTQATVKNVTIVNSMIKQTGGAAAQVHKTGLSAAGGSIFGQVMGEVTAEGTWIHEVGYVNKTHAYIENVYADVDFTTVATGGNGMTGYGGIIGLLQSDATIMQSTYAGNLKAHYRGTAGFVGSIYPVQPQNCDHDFDGATQKFTVDDGNGGTKAVYYKNNDATAAVVGTANVGSINANHCNLEIYDSIFTGSVSNDKCGFVGGVVGYNNVNQSSMTLGHVIIAGSINNAKADGSASEGNFTGFIQGGSWSSPNGDRIDGHGKEYMDYRFFDVTVYDVEGDKAVQAFGKNNDSLRVWYNDGNVDFNGDGAFNSTDWKYKNTLADVNKCVYVATAAELPAAMLVRDGAIVTRNELVLEDSLTYKVKLPVGAIVLAPGKTINDVVTVQFNGTNNKEGVVLTLSEDKAYWEAERTVLPQDIADSSLRLHFTFTKFDAARTVNALTRHDMADTATVTSTATTPYQYLKTVVADETADANLLALAADTLRYVAATQAYFGDLYTGTKVDTTNLPEGAGYTTDDLADESYLPEVEGNTFTYIALQLEGKLAVRIGVTGGTYTATVNGKAAEVVAGEDYILVYFDVADGMYELNVTDATGDNTLFYEYLSDYICVALAMDGVAGGVTENVLVALYNYIYSADIYANS